MLTDYEAKIKILNPEGYKQSEIEIRLFKGSSANEKVHNLEATTYYMENGVRRSIKLDPENIYTEKNLNYDLVKFTFPRVAPGAVLVYSYQKESPFRFNFESWYFQEGIPKLYSEFETKIPGNFRYNIKKVGELQLETHLSEIEKDCFRPESSNQIAECVVSKYAMRDIPAFIAEDYLTSSHNFISRIDYELTEVTHFDGSIKKYTKSWKDVDRELRTEQSIGKQLRRTSLVKNLLPEAIQQRPNDLGKAKSIFEFVRENYTWNGNYRLFSKMDLKDIIKENTGNISAINILLHNIYEEQGFTVLPILGSTRGNGVLTKLYPVLSEFNYLMVQLELDGEKYFLDATEKNIDFGHLPFRSLNQYARLMDFKNGSSWIDIEPEGYSTIMFRDSVSVNPDGTAIGHSEQIFTGYHALELRNKLERLQDDEIFGRASTPAKFTRVAGTSHRNKEQIAEALHIEHELLNSSQMINDAIYLNPFSFAFFDENPFKLKERHYPIDFGYKDAYTYSVHIQIPEGHIVAELPQQKLLRLPENGGTLNFNVQQEDEKSVYVNYRISFPKTTYASGYYPYLKEFFDAIVEVQTQSLIVIRENK
ncbi:MULTISPECIES: DUF3857 domain-containing protein [Antarcticibacterium]|uniref:DUF3857 domain-containing protein n=1 Tax=Antarcticibacterium TaxID=2058174 RepID=UPI00143DF0FE|nr:MULTISPECIES: DUF3857 domain-containing protein [Antarcticibacterium]